MYYEFVEHIQDKFWLYSLQSFTSFHHAIIHFVFNAPINIVMKFKAYLYFYIHQNSLTNTTWLC